MAHLLTFELPGGQCDDLLQLAAATGHRVTLLTADAGFYRAQARLAASLRGLHRMLQCPGFALADVLKSVRTLHASDPVDAVLCLVDTRVVEAAEVARALGLPFLNPDSARLLRDKHAVRQRLAAAGLPQPAFAAAATPAQLFTEARRLGLPLVVKPVDGHASQCVLALTSELDLDPQLGPLTDLLPLRLDYGQGARAREQLLLERQMSGPLLACDTISAAGQHVLLGVHDKTMCEPPSFAVRGCSFHPDHPQRDVVRELAFAALDAVGFDHGAAHIEIMLTPEGPRVVEINPRLVGARLHRLVDAALGGSVQAALIALHGGAAMDAVLAQALGRPVAPKRRTTAEAALPGLASAVRWLLADQAGVLERVDLPRWRHPGLRWTDLRAQPGQRVQPPQENADRLGCVTTRAPSREAAIDLAERWIGTCRLQIKADAATGAAGSLAA